MTPARKKAAVRRTGKSSERHATAPSESTTRIVPVTPKRWDDLERLFGSRGACAGCWCMWWRRERAEWARGQGVGNRRAFREVVRKGDPPGLIAYVDGEPAGWVALAPREVYPRLARSRTLKPIDDKPVWSVTCFFVARPNRRQGLTVQLLEAAADFAKKRGATILEGYPIEPGSGPMADAWVFTGVAAAFRRAGFREAARPSKTRPIMRRTLRA